MCVGFCEVIDCCTLNIQGYPPAQQPVTYTYEELQMMQQPQPQRFPMVSIARLLVAHCALPRWLSWFSAWQPCLTCVIWGHP